MKNFKVASLFTGCGGLDLGLHGGFTFLGKKYLKNPVEIVYATDFDKNACSLFNRNFKVNCQNKDIREVRVEEVAKHDILTGGFPCQSFSRIAQNPPGLGFKDGRGRLALEMCRILKKHKPRCFIAENVKGILSANKREAFPLIIKNFEECGYHVLHKVLDASDYGVPQKRERVFIVGFKNKKCLDNFSFPKPLTLKKKVPLYSVLFPENKIDSKYYFSDRAVAGMKRVRKKMNKGRVQDPKKPCNTVNAHLAKVSLNSTDPVLKLNGKYRRFTPREVARIQSFPETFKLSGTEAVQYRAMGNAVPPVLMWHLAKEVVKTLKWIYPSLLL
ncbi:DNA (cytosine-5-)-methyltransferase [Planctomycetota bacterium]